MDINKIEMILFALHSGSFSKAAEKYSYTPSALSHIADSLEGEIGRKFIRRTHMGIEPADPEIVAALQDICDARDRLMTLAKKEKRITIATYSSPSKYLFPNIIKGFHDLHPEIHMDITVVNSFLELSGSDPDLLFGTEQEVEGYEWTEIMTEPYLAVFPDGYSGDTEFHFDKKYKETFIISNEPSVMKLIDRSNFEDITVVNAHDDSSIIQMVKAGMGISILSSLSVSQTDGITCLPITPHVSRTLGIFKKKAPAATREAEIFVEYFVRKMKPNHDTECQFIPQ